MAFFLDVLKGFLAHWIGYLLGLFPVWIWLCGFFVVFGHDFPIFLKGRGGKGAASAMGFLLGMQPLTILASGLLIGAVYILFRRFNLALSIGMASIPILWWVVLEEPWPEIILLCSFLLFLGLKRLIDEPYMRKIKKENIGNVKLHGYKTGEELLVLIKNSMFAVIPSKWYENNPRSCLEAMALGKTVITTPVGGIPELVDNGINGFFVRRNPKDVADKIIYLYKNPELRKQISIKNLQDAEKFDWENIIDHYIDLYKSTVSI